MCWNKGRLCWKIAKLFYFCHLKKLVKPETFGPYYVVHVPLNAGNPLHSWVCCWSRTLLHVCSSPMSRLSNVCLLKLVWSRAHHKLAATQWTLHWNELRLALPTKKTIHAVKILREFCAIQTFSNSTLSVACINMLYFIFIKTFFDDRLFRCDDMLCVITSHKTVTFVVITVKISNLEIFILLGCHTAMGAVPYRRCCTAYGSHLQGSTGPWPMKMGQICSPERRLVPTTQRCVTSQKSEALTYTAADARYLICV